ncbi:MAG: glycosyltransferase family 39 protein [Alphaproteobacteria bacterium]|nr:glycosyltransferase family 39 protein [Alphaproteobacteria bacterium]
MDGARPRGPTWGEGTAAVLIAASMAVLTVGMAQYYVDAPHAGILFKAALDVAEGKTLFKETLSYYGPVHVVLQALSLLAFGKNVLVIYALAGAFQAASAFVCHLIWRRFLPPVLSLFSLALFVGLAKGASQAWPNHYSTFFTVLCFYFLLRLFEDGRRRWGALSGLALALAVLCRQQLIVPLPLAVFATLALFAVPGGMAGRNVARAAGACLAAAALTFAAFAAWLAVAGAGEDWVRQTVKSVWVFVMPSVGASSPSLPDLYRNVMQALMSVSLSDREVYGVTYYTPRFWVVFGLAALFMALRSLGRAAAGGWRLTVTDASVLVAAMAALTGWVQVYPLTDTFRFANGLMPAVGLLTALLLGAASGVPARWAGVGVAAVLTFVLQGPLFGLAQDVKRMADLNRGAVPDRVRVERPRALAGITLPRREAEFYARMDEALSGYLARHPGTALITTVGDPLPLTFIEQGANAHPMFYVPPSIEFFRTRQPYKPEYRLDVANVLLYPDYYETVETFIRTQKPLVITAGTGLPGYRTLFEEEMPNPYFYSRQFGERPLVTILAPIGEEGR